MAGATMRQPLDQISAPIPFRAARRVRLIGAGAKKQQFPTGNDEALIEREWKLVGWRGGVNRLPRHQIGIERAVVFIADVGEVIVGKGRIEMLADAVDARAHGATERSLRPAPDPGLRIGRDVGRIDRAEWRRPPAKSRPPRTV